MIQRNTRLIVVVGCMGSGKTTEIIRLARIESMKKKVLCVGHANDTTRQIKRSGGIEIEAGGLVKHGFIETHDGGRIPALVCTELSSISKTMEYTEADVIVVDEAQFFPDIKDFITKTRNRDGKDIIFGALDGDSDMNPFFDVGYILPRSTSFKKLTAICSFCGEESGQTRAMFDKKDRIQVGNVEEDYAPCCYLHASMSFGDLPQRKIRGKFIV